MTADTASRDVPCEAAVTQALLALTDDCATLRFFFAKILDTYSCGVAFLRELSSIGA